MYDSANADDLAFFFFFDNPGKTTVARQSMAKPRTLIHACNVYIQHNNYYYYYYHTCIAQLTGMKGIRMA